MNSGGFHSTFNFQSNSEKTSESNSQSNFSVNGVFTWDKNISTSGNTSGNNISGGDISPGEDISVKQKERKGLIDLGVEGVENVWGNVKMTEAANEMKKFNEMFPLSPLEKGTEDFSAGDSGNNGFLGGNGDFSSWLGSNLSSESGAIGEGQSSTTWLNSDEEAMQALLDHPSMGDIWKEHPKVMQALKKRVFISENADPGRKKNSLAFSRADQEFFQNLKSSKPDLDQERLNFGEYPTFKELRENNSEIQELWDKAANIWKRFAANIYSRFVENLNKTPNIWNPQDDPQSHSMVPAIQPEIQPEFPDPQDDPQSHSVVPAIQPEIQPEFPDPHNPTQNPMVEGAEGPKSGEAESTCFFGRPYVWGPTLGVATVIAVVVAFVWCRSFRRAKVFKMKY